MTRYVKTTTRRGPRRVPVDPAVTEIEPGGGGGGGSVTADQQAALDAADPPLDADHPPLTEAGGSLADWVETDSVPGTLTVTPPDSEVDDLVNIVVPETYVDDSNYGRLIRAAYGSMAASEYIFSVALDQIRFKSAPGEGDAKFIISSGDKSASATLGTSGLDISDEDSIRFVQFQTDVGGTGAIGFFDKAATSSPSVQQELARPSGDAGDLWDILAAYGLVKAP